MESHLTHQAVTNISTITTTTATKTTTRVAATDDIKIYVIPEVDVKCHNQLEENWLGFPESDTNTMQDGGDSNSLGLHLLHPEADIRYNAFPQRASW